MSHVSRFKQCPRTVASACLAVAMVGCYPHHKLIRADTQRFYAAEQGRVVELVDDAQLVHQIDLLEPANVVLVYPAQLDLTTARNMMSSTQETPWRARLTVLRDPAPLRDVMTWLAEADGLARRAGLVVPVPIRRF